MEKGMPVLGAAWMYHSCPTASLPVHEQCSPPSQVKGNLSLGWAGQGLVITDCSTMQDS